MTDLSPTVSFAPAANTQIQKWSRFALWCALGIFAGWVVWVGTRAGIGTFGDSVTYYTAAKTLLQVGKLQQMSAVGDMMPLIQFPPGYPIALALLAKVSGGVLAAGRVINILAVPISVVLLGVLTFRFTRSVVLAVLAIGMFAFEGQSIGLQIRMYSEPLYIALLLGILLLLMQHGARGGWLLAAGIAAGAAVLVRFAGVHLIACCTLWIAWVNWRFGWRTAARRTAMFLFPSAGASVAWAVRNKIVYGRSDSRMLGIHPPNWGQFSPLFDTMKPWIIPFDGWWQWPALIAVLALWVIVPVWVLWRYGIPRTGVRARLALPLLVVATYTPFLLVVRSFFDSAVPFNYRLLGPIHPLTLLLAAAVAIRAWRRWGRPAKQWGAIAAIAGLVIAFTMTTVHAAQAIRAARASGAKGIGYAEVKWQQSPTIAAIRAMPESVIVYSNASDAVYLLTGRISRPLPHSSGYAHKRDHDMVEHGLVTLYRDMSRNGAIVVYFTDKSVKRKQLLVSEKQILERVHDPLMKHLPDSRIYYFSADGADMPQATTQPTTPAATQPTTSPSRRKRPKAVKSASQENG